MIYKRLEERRGLKNKIMNLEGLAATELETTMKRRKPIASEPVVD